MIEGAGIIAAAAGKHAVNVNTGASPSFWVLATMLGIISTAVGIWMKDRPKMFELFSKRRADIDVGLSQRVADLEARVDRAVNDAHVAQMQVTTLNAAFQLVAGELSRNDPNNSVLKMAREMIATAATTDNGFRRGMSQMVDKLHEIE